MGPVLSSPFFTQGVAVSSSSVDDDREKRMAEARGRHEHHHRRTLCHPVMGPVLSSPFFPRSSAFRKPTATSRRRPAARRVYLIGKKT
mmetsp:Transcript_16408/g.50905  ORF Transcript_16408/g.50905 Transcript_16408/m.50905 type:complete len:88 (-) Transcript_16408:1078-1341(-)